MAQKAKKKAAKKTSTKKTGVKKAAKASAKKAPAKKAASSKRVAKLVSKVEQAKRDLVIANRILAMEHVVDAYGHASIRHPEDAGRFFLARSLSPELVTTDDIVEYTLDGKAINDTRPPYLERFIHGALYEKRPDVNNVVHAHAEALLPFGLTATPLKPVTHMSGSMGTEVPVWDIADKFGNGTNLLVTNRDQGLDLADKLGNNKVVLMRGHGFSAVHQHLVGLVTMAVYLPANARVLLESLRLGHVRYMSDEESAARFDSDPMAPAARRGWRYWAKKAGVGDLLADWDRA
jgi:HCOMODA/2-hydroxy-3-carboxy-muconic semialdehyde decarboxylase